MSLAKALVYPLSFLRGFDLLSNLLLGGVPLVIGILIGCRAKQRTSTIFLIALVIPYLGVTLPFYFHRAMRNDMMALFLGYPIACLAIGIAVGKIVKKLRPARKEGVGREEEREESK